MDLLPGYGHVVETDSGQSLLPGYGWLVQTSAVGPTYTLAADGASFSLTGTAAGLRASRLLTAASGSSALTGQDVTLTYTPGVTYSMTAESGTFTLSGQDVAMKVARLMSADSGAFVLTGQDVGLTSSPAVDEYAPGGNAEASGSAILWSEADEMDEVLDLLVCLQATNQGARYAIRQLHR